MESIFYLESFLDMSNVICVCCVAHFFFIFLFIIIGLLRNQNYGIGYKLELLIVYEVVEFSGIFWIFDP